MKQRLFLFCLLFFICSCGNKTTVTTVLDLFDETTNLSYKTLNIQDKSDILLSPEGIEIKDNLMITLDGRSIKFFSLIDTKTNVLVKSWGDKGQGPGEIVGLLDFYRNYNNTGINAWDPILRRLNFYSFENILENDNPLPIDLLSDVKSIKEVNNFEGFFPNVLQLNETLFLGTGNNLQKRFTLIDAKNQIKVSVGGYPEADKGEDVIPVLRNQAYNGMVRYNPEQNKVVYLSYESEMLEIFQVKDTCLDLVHGNYTTVPKYTFVSDERGPRVEIEKFTNGKGCFITMAVSDKKIFALYQQYSGTESDSDITAFTSKAADYVLVFDWDGKPVQKCKLDCFVSEIQYDEKSNRLYAVKSKPDPELVYFEM